MRARAPAQPAPRSHSAPRVILHRRSRLRPRTQPRKLIKSTFIGGDLANQRTYAIQGGNTYLYGLLQSFELEEQWVGVYDNLDLSYLGKIPVPCRIDQGPSVDTYGRFVFSSPEGARIYVIATSSTDVALAKRWGLAVLDADGRAL